MAFNTPALKGRSTLERRYERFLYPIQEDDR